MKKSLRDRILEAKTTLEVQELLYEGFGYRWASEHTKRNWDKAAEKRVKELSE